MDDERTPEPTASTSSTGGGKQPRFRSLEPLTLTEARALEAWRAIRRAQPDLHPTASELARVLGVGSSSAHRAIARLLAKGYLAKVPGHRCRGRLYRLTAEAAAAPHVTRMLRLLTDLLRTPPSAVAEPHRERHEVAHAAGVTLLREVQGLVRVLRTEARQEARRMDVALSRSAQIRRAIGVDDGDGAGGEAGPSSP